MKTLKSHTSGLGSTWSLLDNENNLAAICPRVNPDDGLQISADEAERLLTDCVANGNSNPDEESNMWVHAVQPPEDDAECEDVVAWETPDEERDGAAANCPYPSVTELADDVAQTASELEDQLRRIKEMANGILDSHETITITEGRDDPEDGKRREALAGTLTLLEYCQGGIRSAEKQIGADCIN